MEFGLMGRRKTSFLFQTGSALWHCRAPNQNSNLRAACPQSHMRAFSGKVTRLSGWHSVAVGSFALLPGCCGQAERGMDAVLAHRVCAADWQLVPCGLRQVS